jgi:hypothetical protein
MMVLIGFLLVPLFAPRIWMVLMAGGFFAALSAFMHWMTLSGAADGYGTAQPGPLDVLIPTATDTAIYTAAAAVIFGVKRLVRAAPRKPSNID